MLYNIHERLDILVLSLCSCLVKARYHSISLSFPVFFFFLGVQERLVSREISCLQRRLAGWVNFEDTMYVGRS